MQRHGNSREQEIPRMVNAEIPELFFARNIRFRMPSAPSKPAGEKRQWRNDFHLIFGTSGQMQNSLKNEYAKLRFSPVRKDRRECQNSHKSSFNAANDSFHLRLTLAVSPKKMSRISSSNAFASGGERPEALRQENGAIIPRQSTRLLSHKLFTCWREVHFGRSISIGKTMAPRSKLIFSEFAFSMSLSTMMQTSSSG